MKKRYINELPLIDNTTQSEIERKKIVFTVIITFLGLFGTISFLLALGVTYIISSVSNDLPDANLLKAHKPDQTTLIYDINNKLVANIHGDEDRVVVPLNKISTNLQKAVIAIEDNRFYDHKGIDFIGTIRAAATNLSGKGDSVQGGSTLTQQLVKNSFLSPEKSIKRKFVEALLAIKVENTFEKDKILEMYLNQIYWGNQAYGAEKAARRYFKKSAKDLNVAESAILAGLLKAPEAYSPYTNYKKAKLRQKIVLQKMEHYGYITKEQRKIAEKEILRFAPRKSSISKYPYFINYVIYLLRKTYGEDTVRRGGLRVYTTLDPVVQEIGEKTIQQGVKSLSGGSGVKQGALVSINVNNGYVQALVGGVDFSKSNFNRAFQSRRAAGSSFKPVVYLTGLRLGAITSESPITDSPISFNTGWNVWCPHNWDGKFMGRMTVRKALTLSRNTPTVRVGLKVGVDKVIQTARLLGIRGPINKDYSIVLGSLGISPIEMATAYSTLAREGTYIEPIVIRKVEDSEHNLLESHTPNPIQVVSPNYVRELDSILVDVVEKGTGKPAKLKDRPVAGKTGTTDDVRDIWFTGFTPDTVTTIWMGNDQNTELHGVFSSNCAQLWNVFSTEYYKYKKIPPRYFAQIDKNEIKNRENKRKTFSKDSIDNPIKKKTKKRYTRNSNYSQTKSNKAKESAPKIKHKINNGDGGKLLLEKNPTYYDQTHRDIKLQPVLKPKYEINNENTNTQNIQTPKNPPDNREQENKIP